MRGLQYTTTFELRAGEGQPPFSRIWGSESSPARLGPGEYFVLGDFSEQSRDSRLWEFGAYGHPPYAVPESNIIGVATHCYWPLDRLRIFR